MIRLISVMCVWINVTVPQKGSLISYVLKIRRSDFAVSVSENTSGSTYPGSSNFKPNIHYVYFQFEIEYCSYFDGRRHLTESRIRRRVD